MIFCNLFLTEPLRTHRDLSKNAIKRYDLHHPSSFARGAWVLTMGDPRWDPQWDTEWDSHTTSDSTWNNISFPRTVSLTNYVVTKSSCHRWRRLEIVKTTTSHISANIRFHVTGDVANISATMRSVHKCNKKGIMTSTVTLSIFSVIGRLSCQVHSTFNNIFARRNINYKTNTHIWRPKTP